MFLEFHDLFSYLSKLLRAKHVDDISNDFDVNSFAALRLLYQESHLCRENLAFTHEQLQSKSAKLATIQCSAYGDPVTSYAAL